jgi:hypothetical protein
MSNLFFEKPILNSPYHYPEKNWELDKHGQPTQKVLVKEDRSTLNSDISRPFPKPASGCIAVKDINHLGYEVIKVFKVW